MVVEGYKAITISTIVDWLHQELNPNLGYKAITISTIVDRDYGLVMKYLAIKP